MEKRCPNGHIVCGNARFCPVCGTQVDDNPSSNERGTLTILWNGTWMLIDTKIRIKANGMEVGSFSFKKGFKVTIPITDNRIFLDVKFSIRSYQPILPVDPAKNYTLTLNYSRVTGGFEFWLFDENGPLLRL